MGAFCLELHHDDNRDDDLVLIESQQCVRVREKHGRIEDVGADVSGRVGCRADTRNRHRGLPLCGPAGRRPEYFDAKPART
ncbi:unannotated protein [freshwater metagenome]|uniref:Unannotated protein n=1 Tax=freshwater metagenome TaxID=449393 RepID=A0A6J7C3A6_9ZZZZ